MLSTTPTDKKSGYYFVRSYELQSHILRPTYMTAAETHPNTTNERNNQGNSVCVTTTHIEHICPLKKRFLRIIDVEVPFPSILDLSSEARHSAVVAVKIS